ncbi:MAG: undecaprenyl-diphosphate phosphatase [Patescibacteria group bacterium]
MTIFQSIFLGFVQGLTEFLPVSSSGHLALFQEFFGLTGRDLSFEVALHFSTLLAILVFFNQDIFKLKKDEILAVVIGTLPVVIVGLFLKDFIEQIFSLPILVSLALLITGVFNLLIDKNLSSKRSNNEITWKDGLAIGLFQAVAIIPGISRSGSTVLGGLNQKLSRQAAFKFSFILAIPAILGASVLQILDLIEMGFSSISILPYLFGGLTAFLVGLASLSLFKYVIEKAKFEFFAYYCFSVAFVSFVLQFI